CDRREQVAAVKARGQARRLEVDVEAARPCGAAPGQLEQSIAGADVPAAVRFDNNGRARPADAGVDDAEKRGPRRKPFGIGREQVGRCLGIAGWRIGEEVDRRYAWRHLVQHRLHLPRVGTVQAEIREQHDHAHPSAPDALHDRAFAPTDAIESTALSRRGRALLPDRSRGAVKKGSGDAGRYSRSFGLSASIASPPCGEWKAYRVTAAIARKLN